VWRWDQGEPFGNDVPNSNPSGAGAFDFPLRFPGQYFDKETNLAYNNYRDYDPSTGRYVQSDPVGLSGGLNTYAYVLDAPLSYIDEFGQLVNWTGQLIGFGAATWWGGGAMYRFAFTSECKCNKQIHIEGFASMGAWGGAVKGPKGISSPLSGSGGGLNVHSYDDCPESDAGTGTATMIGANLIVGKGVNLLSKTRIGRLYSDWETPFSGWQTGLDVGVSAMWGKSAVTSSYTIEPCCSNK